MVARAARANERNAGQYDIFHISNIRQPKFEMWQATNSVCFAIADCARARARALFRSHQEHAHFRFNAAAAAAFRCK